MLLLTLLVVGLAVVQCFESENLAAGSADNTCIDDPTYVANDNCTNWANAGECDLNPRFMLTACRKSCDCREFCLNSWHSDEECDQWGKLGECSRNKKFMHTHCRLSCGCPPVCEDSIEWAAACPGWAAVDQCDANSLFMSTHCRLSCGCPKPCADRDGAENCTLWQQMNECENNKVYMQTHCAASCNTCHMLDYDRRCPKPPLEDGAVQPGVMNQTFANAVVEFAELEPTMLSYDPPILLFEKFLQPEEVETLLSYGEGNYQRALTRAGRKDDEFVAATSEIRTAWNAWCNKTCADDPVVQRITERMSNVSRVPANNSEPIQFLRYLSCPNETHPDCHFYRRHHDFIPELNSMPPGPRIFTFFLYLSDVYEGGGTTFDGGFTVQPRAGRAVFWPSTHNLSPFEQDDRTHHEALPVLNGTKYAANFWLHQFDYITPYNAGCTG